MHRLHLIVIHLSLFYNVFFISCFLFFTFVFFSFAIVFINNCIFCYIFLVLSLFLSKFVNFYFERYKTKNRIRSKKIRCKNNKRQETGNKKHIVEDFAKNICNYYFYVGFINEQNCHILFTPTIYTPLIYCQ